MQNREAEIEGLEKGFRASVMTEIGRYRAKNGDLNTVPQFISALGVVRETYARKFASLRAEPENQGRTEKLIDLTEAKIERQFKDEVERATRTGVVDFDI
jgi:hypothetical protein